MQLLSAIDSLSNHPPSRSPLHPASLIHRRHYLLKDHYLHRQLIVKPGFRYQPAGDRARPDGALSRSRGTESIEERGICTVLLSFDTVQYGL